jgi:hypothetical protein
MIWGLMRAMIEFPFRVVGAAVTGPRDVASSRLPQRPGTVGRPTARNDSRGVIDDLLTTGGMLIDGLVGPVADAVRPVGPRPNRWNGSGSASSLPNVSGSPDSVPVVPPTEKNGRSPGGKSAGGKNGIGGQPRSNALPLNISAGARGRLDPSRFVVIGDDLAAGMGELGLSEESQLGGFAAVLARQMGVDFVQPLFEAPGLARPVGLANVTVRPPALFQTTVLREFPPAGLPGNLAVPGFSVADALRRRPCAPLTSNEACQTAANLILGLPDLLYGRKPPTQLEAALRLRPTFLLVALGCSELLRFALALGEPAARPPSLGSFRKDYAELLGALTRPRTDVVVVSIPNPLETAAFSTLEAARRLLGVDASFLPRAYDLSPDDRLTVAGLFEVGCQIQRRTIAPIGRAHVLRERDARAVCSAHVALNAVLRDEAGRHGAGVYDLAAFLSRIHREGIAFGDDRVSGEYLGGFYTLNGLDPGGTGHALIADDLLGFLNDRFGGSFPPVDLAAVAASDPVAHYRRGSGDELNWETLNPRTERRARQPEVPDSKRTIASRPPRGYDGGAGPSRPTLPLRLPPGLEQTLPLNTSLSYHGDGMRVVNCLDEAEAGYGLCGNALFGGLALFGSHLNGSIRIRFTPPSNDFTRFTVNFLNGVLAGEDGVLAAPHFFRFPILESRVSEWSGGPACTGTLNLATGEVTDLESACSFSNSGLAAIAAMNPRFPNQAIRFPGSYGSASAVFKQRPDGMLDFNFQGSTFIPLGQFIPPSEPFRFPLPFGGRSGEFASVPAQGTALHPNLHLSTESRVVGSPGREMPIPTNTIHEYVVCTKQSSFGDVFTLHATDLGVAHGRSHVQGRIQVQYGERFGDAVPVHIALLPPAGLFEDPSLQPLQGVFPARLSRGLLGHNEFLQFPLRTYYLDNVYLLEDPFDLALGAVDVRTGDVIGDLVHRGFIGQDTFFALVRVEPRTPQSSFRFRGPASFRRGPLGQLVYQFDGQLTIPYPEGFLFPATDLATGVAVGADSKLDPFLEIVAVHADQNSKAGKSGHAEGVISSIGARFSYEYSVGNDGRSHPARFRYSNDLKGANFELCPGGLSAVTFHQSGPGGESRADTVTFTGFGTWSIGTYRSLHQATVQVSTTPGAPYVSILIDGGRVSNVNTRPKTDQAQVKETIKAS